jgi:mRNA interferase MazF
MDSPGRGEVWLDVQNIVTIPHAKLLRKLGDLTYEQMVEVENALLFWLGFEEGNAEESEK